MTPGAISMAMARLTLTISSSSPIALARQAERRKTKKKKSPGLDSSGLFFFRIGTYPLAPLLASLVVGYACACEEGGTVMGLARDCSRGFLGSMA